MSKYPIIVFEGIEGTGKSTHINNIVNFFKKNKIKFIKIREPGGTFISEKIRKLILSNKSKFNYKTDFLLFMASRSENINNIILKNYKKRVILIDRFIHSTIAYQHYGMGINLNLIKKINSFILDKIKPDYIFLNLINKKNLRTRLLKRKKKNKYDKFNFEFYKRVQTGFIKELKKNKSCFIVDSNLKLEDNKKIIINKIKKIIKH